MQQIELIAIQGTLYGIDDDIDLVVRKLLGDKISFSDGTPIALLKV